MASPSSSPRGAFAKGSGDLSKSPIMVVLVGYPGSGKSKFCYDLFEEENVNSTWTIVCQDTLKSRHRCEEVARDALISGHRVIVDRCNMDAAQRKTWIDLANEHWPFKSTMGAHVLCVHMDTPVDECVKRCEANKEHPTIPSQDAAKVVRCQASEYVPPSLDEGFCAILDVSPDDIEFRRGIVEKLSQPLLQQQIPM